MTGDCEQEMRTESDRFEGHTDDAIHKLKNERTVMYVDPNGYSTGIRAVNVAYIFHEAGRFRGIADYLMGQECGIIPERKVRAAVRENGCKFIKPQEVPEHVR